MTLREAVCASSASRSEGHFFIDSESPTFPLPQLGSSVARSNRCRSKLHQQSAFFVAAIGGADLLLTPEDLLLTPEGSLSGYNATFEAAESNCI